MTQEQIDSVLKAFQFAYEDPIIIDSSEYIFIPISTDWPSDRPSKGFLSSGGKYYSSDYWNIFFYNRKTNETRLLTKKKRNYLPLFRKKARKKYL